MHGVIASMVRLWTEMRLLIPENLRIRYVCSEVLTEFLACYNGVDYSANFLCDIQTPEFRYIP